MNFQRSLPAALALFLLALVSLPGCITRVVTARGPVSTTVRGVTVELAPEVSGEHITSGEGGESATVTSGPTTVVIEKMNMTVNGRPYGSVEQGNRVFIGKDTVKVNGEVREPLPQ